MNSKVTYRQQFTRCGKQRCRKCREGAGHGPYWYAYWSENGRTISKYIGMQLPTEVEVARQQETETTSSTSRQNTPPEKLTTYTELTPLLRIYLLGQFRLERRNDHEWCAVTNRTWQRRRARALLGCLLSSPGRRLGREQVMEALWPELDIETAANRLNGAVHELRQILEPEITRPAASSMLRLQRDVLELADRNHIWVDADTFESLLNQANTTTDIEQVEHILEEAAALYGGDYLLEELYSEWATPRREALRRRWMGLLLHLADLRAARGALASAIEPLDRLLVSDPTHETAVRQLMLLLTQLDRRGEALQAYQRLSAALERDYSNDPLPETRELYEALRQGHIQPSRPKLLSSALAPSLLSTGESPDATLPALPTRVDQPTQEPHAREDQEPSAKFQAPFPRPVFQLSRYNQSPLIGRDRELETMHQFIAAFSATNPDNHLLTTQGIHTTKASGSLLTEQHMPDAHFLLLIGEAGIGKTRLAEELSQAANAQDWSIAWSRSYEQEGTIPYRPWTELLRILLHGLPAELLLSSLQSQTSGLLGPNTPQNAPTDGESISIDSALAKLERLSALLPELRDLFPQLKPASLVLPEQERLYLWEAMLALLSALGKMTPLLLVLDDLHWADESSLEMLVYLARHLREQRVLLIGTCRDIELLSTHSLRTLINDLRREQAIITLPVQPLTQSQIGMLVAHLPEKVVQRIQTQAGGNPFFAEELARYVRVYSEDTTSTLNALPTPAEPRTSLPETIAAVLDRRLARLSNDCQTLLGKAAVLGGPFEFNQLLYMESGQPQNDKEDIVLDLLEEALHAGLLTEEGSGVHVTYHFWHPLIISHLYENLSAARRAQLHRRAASAMLHLHQGHEGKVAEAVTYHLIKGGSATEQISHYAEMAGNQAYSLAAYVEAQHYYRQAVLALCGVPIADLTGKEQPSSGITAPLSEIHQEGALHLLTITPETCDPLHVARLLELISECCIIQGNYAEARHLYKRILELRNQPRLNQETHTPETTSRESQREAQIQALIWCKLGSAWTSTGDYANAHQCFERGKQVMSEAGIDTGGAWAGLQLQQGATACIEGNFEESQQHVYAALKILEQVLPDQQAAKKHYGELRTPSERTIEGDPLDLGNTHEMLGVIASYLGHQIEGLEHLHIALEIYEKHDLIMAMAKVCSNLGAVYATKANHTTARNYFQRSIDLSERLGDIPNICAASGNMGELASRTGNLLEAEKYHRYSIMLAERTDLKEHLVWCIVALARVLHEQGKLDEALKQIHHAIVVARAVKNQRLLAPALLALGEVRLTQASIFYQGQVIGSPSSNGHAYEASKPWQSAICRRILQRAHTTLQRALVLEGLEVELIIEGQVIQAYTCFMLGDLEESERLALQIVQDATQQELSRELGRAQRLLGLLLTSQGKVAEATAYFEQALELFQGCEMRLEYARTLRNYAAALLQHSHLDEQAYTRCVANLCEARAIFARCHAAIDLESAENLLTAFYAYAKEPVPIPGAKSAIRSVNPNF